MYHHRRAFAGAPLGLDSSAELTGAQVAHSLKIWVSPKSQSLELVRWIRPRSFPAIPCPVSGLPGRVVTHLWALPIHMQSQRVTNPA